MLCYFPTQKYAMAVDRSKFRTCQQTSFCRRHRHGHSASLYQYKLLKDTVHLHVPSPSDKGEGGSESEGGGAAAAVDGGKHQQGGGVWQSIQRRLLGDHSGNAAVSGSLPDESNRPPPTLTGTIVNKAPETSSKTTEHLQWSVYCLRDGTVRMRITEQYGRPGTAYEQPRVTYDDLVLLDHGTHAVAEHAVWIRPQDKHPLLSKLVTDPSQRNNFMALRYGDAVDETVPGMVLLIQLDPFVVSLYREASLEAGPIVVLGAQNMMHFEVRRFQNGKASSSSDKSETEGDKSPEEAAKEVETKPEKEIVGYWEDGLAIYADGTREERKEDTTTKQQEEVDHRQLSQAELDREGMWEEKFGSHTDSKPYGPMSIGMDIAFPQSKHLYGIPEHASSAILQKTVGEDAHYKEPYRLYNLDVFEYELDETMTLYGNIPLIVSQSMVTGTTGVFWFNPTESFVDVMQDDSKSTTHWMSESGVIDIFLMPGPDPASLYDQYAKLTGTTALPPMFSLGYHQCRWNYKDEADVYYVHGKFEELDYPYDVLWLDIDHTNGKRYFTWDSNLFPNPKEMQEKLASQGRRMVTIIDPHIFRDDNYYIHKEATAKGLYVKDKEGKNDYDGWCWPGSSSYLDFTAEHVRSWWAEQFQYSRYKGSTPTLFTWNDMNEPSVFNGPEVSMQKDLRNLKGHEHREWHNLYGMLFHRATMEGQIGRNTPQDVRPFVLSRAFFAGTQRYGAIWTGDNTADWGHLQIAAPMLLSMNSAALTFVGADVGGFFGNPDAELITRWTQAGAYTPFFRGHAHHDSKRREPWMFDEDTLNRMRQVTMERYALLPFWYTVFKEAETTGMPIMRMMWMHYPQTEDFFGIDDQYLIGSDLLVKPITAAGEVSTEVRFPGDDLWYDAQTLELVSGVVKPKGAISKKVPAPMDKIPVFQRGGSIIPRKLRLRRSTMMMKTDPYTLYVALDASQKAKGTLYMDDEETFGYEKRFEFANATFSADLGSGKQSSFSCDVTVGSGWTDKVESLGRHRMIERIIIVGLKASPKEIKLEGGKDLEFSYSSQTKMVVIRKPELSALVSWRLSVDTT